jgi:hypothetical protein
VTKWRGVLGLAPSLIRWIFLEDPLDIGAQCRELFSLEDAVKNDVAIRLKLLRCSGSRAQTE